MKHLEKVNLYSVKDEKASNSKWILAETQLLAKIYFIKLFPDSTLQTITHCVNMNDTPNTDYECFFQDHPMGKVKDIEATGYLTWATKEQRWELDFYPRSQ